jgi:hypothetical protein
MAEQNLNSRDSLMRKPLPDLFDDIDKAILEAKSASASANMAADNANRSAQAAREAGIEAAGKAAEVAADLIGKMQEDVDKNLKDLQDRFLPTERGLEALTARMELLEIRLAKQSAGIKAYIDHQSGGATVYNQAIK